MQFCNNRRNARSIKVILKHKDLAHLVKLGQRVITKLRDKIYVACEIDNPSTETIKYLNDKHYDYKEIK